MKKKSAYSKRRYALPLGILTLAGAAIGVMATDRPVANATVDESAAAAPTATDSLRYITLTLADFERAANELDIPVAAIRAVAEIEAGPKCEGFNRDQTPIINFDLVMFRQAATRRGINVNKFKSSHPEVFKAPDKKKYGSTQAAQYARLESAMTIDTVAALEGTFWGMFQIGGFNWKICGCSSVEQFVSRMSESEFEQLELFIAFIRSRNLVRFIKNRQWEAFSLRYNGPGFRKHAYDKRMAAAFAKYSKAATSH